MPIVQATKPPQKPIQAILVVEDDALLRETIVESLEMEGYSVRAAKDGEEGLEQMRALPKPCLVLLDLLMPVLGGRELLAAMLQDAYLAPIPVLIVSSATDGIDLGGAKAVIKKPVSLELLLRLVEQFAQGQAPF